MWRMQKAVEPAIEALLAADDPCIRWKVRVKVLGEDPGSAGVRALQEEIRTCPRVRRLLSERDGEGQIPYHPYAKWHGGHWVLAALADIGYPPGDESLIPLRERVYAWLLSEAHVQGVPIVAGRARRCGSQEGNALYALLTLGLADERTDDLAGSVKPRTRSSIGTNEAQPSAWRAIPPS